MAGQLTPKREALLMDGMADKLHADLSHARANGTISRADALAMATRCKACTKRDDCILWMLDHSGGAEHAPPFCLNAETLEGLAEHNQS